jgi:hypothetical protein
VEKVPVDTTIADYSIEILNQKKELLLAYPEILALDDNNLSIRPWCQQKNASENSIARISINCELFLWVLVYTAWSRYFQLAGEFAAHQVISTLSILT